LTSRSTPPRAHREASRRNTMLTLLTLAILAVSAASVIAPCFVGQCGG
jgi:hypothetical protein